MYSCNELLFSHPEMSHMSVWRLRSSKQIGVMKVCLALTEHGVHLKNENNNHAK